MALNGYFLGPKIWDSVPLELKHLKRLEVFKLKIQKWIPFESFDCVKCIYNKLGLVKAVRLTRIIVIIIFTSMLYTTIYV